MANEITLYGIANCDTVKKAKAWLDARQLEFGFHDYRKQGLDSGQLQTMVAQLGWQTMLNRRGSTWRKLPDRVKENVDEATAIEIMLDNPAIIKRPILALGRQLYLGFSDDQYREIFD